MTEKLLKRPPFRYIHDIISATIEATGFGTGIFIGDETVGKSIGEKDQKVFVLQKVVDLVSLAVGQEIDVKPIKIVAGQECEKTNYFLQYFYQAATAGNDSTDLVAQVLASHGQGEEGAAPEQAEDEDNGGEDEEEAQRQAQAEEQRVADEAAAEEERRERKRQKKREMMEAKKAQEEEEEAARAQQAAHEEPAQEEKVSARQESSQPVAASTRPVRKRKKEEKEDSKPKGRIIRDGDDDDEEDSDEQEENQRQGANYDNAESKFAKQALEQMNQDEEEVAPQEEEPEEGGIRFGKRKGHKNKKGGVERSNLHKKVITQPKAGMMSTGIGYDEKDIDFMKNAIQALCQSTNPLGKSIDFVTEDIDSMVKEFQRWKSEYGESKERLTQAQKVTEDTVQPLQDELAQVEERIRETSSKISNLRRQVTWNDSTIQNLLNSVISSTN